MPKEKEPREQPAETAREQADSADSLSLVDYFDQMDRAAFRRSLEYRDVSRARSSTD